MAQQQKIPVIVDPKGKEWKKYEGATLVTPNLKELGDIVGHSINNSDTEIETTGKEVLSQFHLSSLLVTRSEKGMSLIQANKTLHIPTSAQEVFDVSGAGDTVVATLALALANNMAIQDSIHLANIAAGIVVCKIGTATLSLNELEIEVNHIPRFHEEL